RKPRHTHRLLYFCRHYYKLIFFIFYFRSSFLLITNVVVNIKLFLLYHNYPTTRPIVLRFFPSSITVARYVAINSLSSIASVRFVERLRSLITSDFRTVYTLSILLARRILLRLCGLL